MKIHEYQAKELFRQFNIPTDSGVLVSDKNAELDIPFLPPIDDYKTSTPPSLSSEETFIIFSSLTKVSRGK